MRLSEAESWLLDNASEPDTAFRELVQYEQSVGVTRITPPTDEMWGPDDYRDWSHDAMVWRLVFLQCVIKNMGKQLEQKK